MNVNTHTTYPDFVADVERHAWDKMPQDERQKVLDAADYVRAEYPDEQLSLGLIGTVLTFGG